MRMECLAQIKNFAQLTEKLNVKVLKAVALVVDHIIIDLEVGQVVSEKKLLWGPSRKCDVPRYIDKIFVGNLGQLWG